MGYSCTVAAANVVDMILAHVTEPGGSSNSWTFAGSSYFYETGREHEDGRVTGTVWRTYSTPEGDFCSKAGRVLVTASGKLVTFPAVPRAAREVAKAAFEDDTVHTYHHGPALGVA